MQNRSVISFRANEDETIALQLMAEQESRKLSEMVRECIREAATRRGIVPICLANNLTIHFKNGEVEIENT